MISLDCSIFNDLSNDNQACQMYGISYVRHMDGVHYLGSKTQPRDFKLICIRIICRSILYAQYTRPCNRTSSCRYCPLLNVSGSFTCKTNNQILQSKINVNCQTSNCIYLITCSNCGIQYVGQTKNKILTRFNSHHYDIQHNSDTTVARHFNKCPRNNPAKFEGLVISVLCFIRSPPDTKSGQTERDMEEKRWIHRLSSVVPRGLNLLD